MNTFSNLGLSAMLKGMPLTLFNSTVIYARQQHRNSTVSGRPSGFDVVACADVFYVNNLSIPLTLQEIKLNATMQGVERTERIPDNRVAVVDMRWNTHTAPMLQSANSTSRRLPLTTLFNEGNGKTASALTALQRFNYKPKLTLEGFVTVAIAYASNNEYHEYLVLPGIRFLQKDIPSQVVYGQCQPDVPTEPRDRNDF